MNSWEQIKSRLAAQLTSEAFQNWLSRTSWGASEGSTMRVAVPDEVTRVWLQQEYSGEIWTAIRDLGLPYTQIIYELESALRDVPSRVLDQNPGGVSFAPSVSLNPRFTFDTFVVGSCNQFAHAAARAVATVPSKTYNPLFIYGGAGMGKTHLMHAIGRELSSRYAKIKVVYTSSERFMNEMITCIKLDRMQTFHTYYRSADVLLVDDIQILANKERTQEEFFHTFNELYEHQKQIVVSSDLPPKSVTGLVDRLRSRFEWGLMVDVQPPDLETKMAILDKKAESEGVKLPEDVRIFIATRTKSNVRELEGSLVKLIAYSSVTGSPINMAMAQQALKHLTMGSERRISMDSIIRAVADKFNLQPGQLKQKTNAQDIAYPRQIAMYLIKELTPASLPEIGRAFGGKHHTTVLHSVHKIEELRHRKQDLNSLLHSISDSFH